MARVATKTAPVIPKPGDQWRLVCRLVDVLERKGITQADLGRITGLGPHLVNKYVKATPVEPGAVRALMIAKALGVSVEDIWTIEPAKAKR